MLWICLCRRVRSTADWVGSDCIRFTKLLWVTLMWTVWLGWRSFLALYGSINTHTHTHTHLHARSVGPTFQMNLPDGCFLPPHDHYYDFHFGFWCTCFDSRVSSRTLKLASTSTATIWIPCLDMTRPTRTSKTKKKSIPELMRERKKCNIRVQVIIIIKRRRWIQSNGFIVENGDLGKLIFSLRLIVFTHTQVWARIQTT